MKQSLKLTKLSYVVKLTDINCSVKGALSGQRQFWQLKALKKYEKMLFISR